MPVLDGVFAAVLGLSMVLGAWRGLIFEVLSLLSWVAAFALAQWLAADVAAWLPLGTSSDVIRYGLGFVLVFVGVVLAGGLLAALLKKLLSTVGLRPADRALGALFGLCRGVLVLLLAALLTELTPLRTHAMWQESTGAGWAVSLLKVTHALWPADLQRFFPA